MDNQNDVRQQNCPCDDDLSEFSVGKLPDAKYVSVAQHVMECSDCSERLTTLAANDDTLVSQVRAPIPAKVCNDEDRHRAIELAKAIGHKSSHHAPRDEPIGKQHEGFIQQIGTYQILEKIGAGGMGAVYRARHTKLDKIVAIKVLSANRLQYAESIARFEREMKAVGKLEHPNIVRATDADEDDGVHYLVMEYVQGVDLSQLVKQHGPLGISDACELVRQAAIGLDYAHQQGLVHRDIKPSNLMLTVSETKSSSGANIEVLVKILDMGLALLDSRRSAGDEELTASGQIMGTLEYMAPEQCGDSHQVDIRADIYSLGATLFKLLTGHSPFSGPKYDTPVKLMMAVATEDAPSIHDQRDDVPDELAKLIDGMLAKSPDDRFSTPLQVATALEPFARGHKLLALCRDSATGVDPNQVVGQAVAGTRDDITSDSVDTEPSQSGRGVDTPQPNTTPQPIRDSRRVKMIAGTVLTALLLGVILTIQFSDGTVVVEGPDGKPLPEDVTIELKNSDDNLTIGSAQKWKIDASPGSYKIDIQDGADRFHCDSDVLSVSRFGKTILTIRRKQKIEPEQPADDGLTPDQRVARWLFEIGGTLMVDDDQTVIDSFDRLPAREFKIWWIDLTKAEQIGSADMARFADLSKLRVLHLHNQRGITDEDLKQLSGLPLTGFYMNFTNLTGEGWQHLPMQDVDFLYAGTASLQGDSLKYVGPKLDALNLRGAPIIDDHLKYFKNFPELTYLKLDFTKVTDAGLKQLASLKKLEYLNLDETEITDGAVKHLAVLECLKTLSIADTHVTDAGLAQLHEFPALESLNIDRCAVSQKAIDALKVALPNLEVSGEGTVPTDHDHKVAEWVVSQGGNGRCQVLGEEEYRDFNDKEMPSQPFKIGSIGFVDAKRIKDEDISLLAGLQHLGSLQLNNQYLTDASAKYFKRLPKLGRLFLINSSYGDEGLRQISEIRDLHALYISSPMLTDEGLAALSNATNLDWLNLAGGTWTGASLKHIAKLNLLKVLHIDVPGANDDDIQQLAALKNLEDLTFFKGNLTEAGLQKLSDQIPGCRVKYETESGWIVVGNTDRFSAEYVLGSKGTLEIEVGGQRTKISDASQLPLTEFELVSIDLTRQPDAVHYFLHTYLIGLKNLLTLKLDARQLVDSDIPRLHLCQALQHISLHNGKITDEGLKHLYELKQLKSLDFIDCPSLTNEGIAALKEALPDCEVLRD